MPRIPSSQRYRYRRDGKQWMVRLDADTAIAMEWVPCDEPEFYDNHTSRRPFNIACFFSFDSLSVDFALLGMEPTLANMEELCAWLNKQWEENPLG